MKKIIFIFTLVLTGTKLFAFTLNVSSYVIDMNSSPVSNHTVYIEAHDSSLAYNYSNSVTTDSSGNYFFYVTNVPSQNILFTISTYDCNNNQQFRYVFVSSGNPSAFQICVNSSPSCNAQFYYYIDSLNPGTYHFINTSTNYTSNQWLVNNTIQSTQTHFTTSFQNPSLNTVCLIVSGQAGCSDSTCSSVLVHNCSNSFVYSANGTQVTFTASAAPNPISYIWTFGDGTSQSTMQGSVSHTYGGSGQYLVGLTTIDLYLQDTCTAFSSQNISITASNTGSIFGYVFADSNYLDVGKIEIYEKNPVSQKLTLIDSTNLIPDSATNSSYYIFTGKPYGNYYIKSIVEPSSSYFGSYYNSWYPNSINWNNATQLTLNSNQVLCNIILQKPQASIVPGSSSISGYINNMSGISLNNEIVFLLNQNKLILDAFILNPNAGFHFDNLAFGTYYLRPEITNIQSLDVKIILNSANPEVSQLEINLDSNHFFVGVQPPENTIADLSLFPNPATDNIRLKVETISSEILEISIFNATGRMILSEKVNSTGIISKKYNLTELPEGLYFIMVSDGRSSQTRKFIKQ